MSWQYYNPNPRSNLVGDCVIRALTLACGLCWDRVYLELSVATQNAFITQGLSNEVDQLYNRLSNCPVPSTPVYGRTPIFTPTTAGGTT